MDLPPWLKIENLIGKLNLRGMFKYERKQINITNNFNIQIVSLPLNTDESPKSGQGVPVQKVNPIKEIELEFTDTEKIIIAKVNQIHRLNNSDYDFKDSYRLALQHIRQRSSPDWFVIAAAHMANAIQSGGVNLGIENFFNCFETEDDPKRSEVFARFKEKIKYCYERLQNLRHIDKSEELMEHMIPKYRRNIYGQEKITDEDYNQIFTDFQNLLVELFKNYKLKNL